MSRPLRVGVTGAGGEARWYMDAYVRHSGSELVVVQDIDVEKAKAQADRFPGVEATTEFARLLADDIDVVDVSTPNHLHPSQTIAALEAGKHVICQKPMAPTIADCDRMIEAAAHTGKTLGIYMGSLSSAVNHELRTMIASGFFGTVSSVSSRSAHRGPYQAKDNTAWRGSLEKTGGGSFIQLAIHPVNLFQWLFADGIVEVVAKSTNRLCQHSLGGDDLTHAVGVFGSGMFGSFESGYAAEGGWMAFNGTKGSYFSGAGGTFLWSEEEWDGEVIRFKPRGFKEFLPLEVKLSGEQMKALSLQYDQHAAFIDAVACGAEPPVPASVGRRDVAICKAVVQSSEENRPIRIADMR